MTIEIKQLIIRAIVEPGHEAAPAEALRRTKTVRERGWPSAATSDNGGDREAVIATCVREVLRELRKGRER